MKFAAISDIHGNLTRSMCWPTSLAGRGHNRQPGDIVSGHLQPRATAAPDGAGPCPPSAATMSGNCSATPPAWASRMPLRAQLLPEQLAWIAALPATLRLRKDVLLVHGTPQSDLVYFLDSVTPQGSRAATPAEVAERAGPADAALILCGHAHAAQHAAGRRAPGRQPGQRGLASV
jgi:hypothetical protein